MQKQRSGEEGDEEEEEGERWKGGGVGTGEESIALHSLAPPPAQMISRKYNALRYGIKGLRH